MKLLHNNVQLTNQNTKHKNTDLGFNLDGLSLYPEVRILRKNCILFFLFVLSLKYRKSCFFLQKRYGKSFVSEKIQVFRV